MEFLTTHTSSIIVTMVSVCNGFQSLIWRWKIIYSRLPSGPVQAAGMYCEVDDLTRLFVPINLINLPIYLPSARALDYRTCCYQWVSVHDEIFLFVVQGEKRQPYDEDIRVPLIVRGPKVPRDMNTDALALNIDLVRKGSFRMLWILEYPVSSPCTKFDEQWTS